MNCFEEMKGKVYVITGGAGAGAGGTGAEICRRLVSVGAFVALWDIADEKGKAMENGSVLYVHADVRREEDVKAALEKTVARLGRIDGLVNNAFWHADVQPPLHEMTLEDWDAHVSINLRCHFIVCKYVIPYLLKQKSSVILNMSTTGAHRGEDGYYGYSAAKAGLEALTRNIAAEYGRNGLRANSLAPGLILSPTFDEAVKAVPEYSEAFGRIDRNNLLFPGHGSGSDIADIALFLLSDMSRYITGQCIVADGGTISHFPQWAETHREIQN